MAVRFSIASGNLTTAATWGLVDATSYLNVESVTHLVTTAYSGTRTQPFTPGAITVAGIAVKVSFRAASPSGTFTVHLATNADHVEVAGTAVTVNVSDIPSITSSSATDIGWFYLQFASPVLLLDAVAYEVESRSSSSNQINLWRDSTVGNVSHALVTTTTGAPAAGDDMIIGGLHTGAGATTAVVVAMDNVDTTDYGAASTSSVLPAVSICQSGTLQCGTMVGGVPVPQAATAYNLRLSGHAIVYAGGVLSHGTTGTPIPSGSTCTLQFDCAADGNFGLYVRNLGTCNLQGNPRTYDRTLLAADVAGGATSLTSADSTGWLSGDNIGIASTTQTSSQCEKRVLNGNASGTTINITVGLTNTHSGTSPTQAEIINLTRNVIITVVTTTAVAFVYVGATATVDADWAEFSYLGENAASKRGIEIATRGGACSINRCSIHDIEDWGVYVTPANATGTILNFTNNVMYNLVSAGSGGQAGFYLALYPLQTSNCVVTGNILMLITGSNTYGWFFPSPSSVFNSNTVAGAFATGFLLGNIPAAGQPILTPTGNIAHSGGMGLSLFTTTFDNTYDGFNIWRCLNGGIIQTSYDNVDGLVLSNFTITGCGTAAIALGKDGAYILNSVTINSDASFATPIGIDLATYASIILTLENCAFGSTGPILATGIRCNVVYTNVQATLRNTLMNCTTEFTSQANILPRSYVRSQKHDQTPGNHKAWLRYGTITIDTVIYRTASPSQRLTPNNATKKFESAGKSFRVASGATATPSVWVYKSAAGDGAAYNGNQPRLVLKKNVAAGISADTVLATAAHGLGTWVGGQLSGTTPAVTDDAILTVVVDCDGTAGWVNTDDWAVT